MNEVAQGSLALLANVLTAISAWFWMLGGRSIEELQKAGLAWFGQKSNRVFGRLIAPIFFSLSVIGISLLSNHFSYLSILLIPAYLVISHSGHHTFFRRLIECWCYALPGVLYVYIYAQVCTFKTPFMFIFIQLLLSTVAAVIGHFNQEKNAPVIEYVVAFLRVLLIPLMVI